MLATLLLLLLLVALQHPGDAADVATTVVSLRLVQYTRTIPIILRTFY
jgi:hypothetical protein